MKRLVRLGDRLLEEAGGILLLVLVVVALAQVFSRYLFAVSLPWTEELARFLFTWVIWIGAAVGLRRAQHMRFTFLSEALAPGAQAVLRCVVDGLIQAFLAFLVVQGWRVAESAAQTAYIAIPWLSVKYAYLVTVVMGGVMCAGQAAVVARDLRALRRGAGA